MSYKLVIFDCDGTLIDTAADVVYCFNSALESCGFSACSFEAASSLIGRPLEVIVEGLLVEATQQATVGFSREDVVRVSAAYREIYGRYEKPNTKPFPGMVQLVDDLLKRGVSVGVNSNKPESALISLMEECFPGRGLQVIGYTPDRPTKPNPTGVFELMNEANAKSIDVVYVGDTVVDFDTANGAGIGCVIVTWGQGDRDLYVNQGLAACCSTVDDLRLALLQ